MSKKRKPDAAKSHTGTSRTKLFVVGALLAVLAAVAATLFTPSFSGSAFVPAANTSSRVNPPKQQQQQQLEKVSDKHDATECERLAAQGECAKNVAYMAESCARSCAGKLPAAADAKPQAQPDQAQRQEQKRPGPKFKGTGTVAVDWSFPPLPAELQRAQEEADARVGDRAVDGGAPRAPCADARPDCATLARANLSAYGQREPSPQSPGPARACS